MTDPRTTTLPVDPQFPERWSPRSFRPEPLGATEIETLFEAARWAPSAANEQPWLFVYASTESGLARLRPLIEPGNREWADRAPLLAVLFARRRNGKGVENRWSAFDAGAAWMSLALQARKQGLFAHAMGGFLEEPSYAALGVDRSDWQALVAIAVGRQGERSQLSERLAAREAPNGRKPLAEIARRVD